MLFSFSEEQKSKIIQTVLGFFNFKKDYKPQAIDFSKPWWSVFFLQPKLVFVNVFNSAFSNAVFTSSPLLLAWVIGTKNLTWMLYLVLGFIAVRSLSMAMFRYHPIFAVGLENDIASSAYSSLIVVDPISHTTKSSGQIISKINRGSKAAVNIADTFVFRFTGLIMAVITASFSVVKYSWQLSLVVLIFCCFLAGISIFGFRLRAIIFREYRIEKQDKFTAISVESMQQASYIRANFATDNQLQKISNRGFKAAISNMAAYRISGYIISTIQVLFLLSSGVLFWWLYSLNLPVTEFLAVAVVYFNLRITLEEAGRISETFFTEIENLQDLFKFISNFGQQTYPVLEGDVAGGVQAFKKDV